MYFIFQSRTFILFSWKFLKTDAYILVYVLHGKYELN